MTWILTALAGALTGGFCFLLLVLLTRFPRRPVRIGSLVWSGWLTTFTNHQLPKQLASLVMELRPHEQIRDFLMASPTREAAETWIRSQLSHYLITTVPEKWPMLSLIIGEKTQDKVLTAVSEHIHSNWTPSIQQLCSTQLSEQQVQQRLISIMRLDKPAIWTEILWKSLKKALPRLFGYVLLLSSLLALVGRLCYAILLNL
jgi:hypothetical protein